MKKFGLGLLLVSALVVIGSFIWVMVTEADEIPVLMYVVFGTAALGFVMLLAAAIVDRRKQMAQENFEKRDN